MKWGNENYKRNLHIYDPYIDNTWIDSEWTFSEHRLELLDMLAKEEMEWQERLEKDAINGGITSGYNDN